MTKRFGFTLAEVLITLGIIGVVAAMTMPTLINQTNGAQYKAGYKKALSTISQGITLNVVLEDYDFKDLSGTAGSGNGSMLELMKKRMNVINDSAENAIKNYVPKTAANGKKALKAANTSVFFNDGSMFTFTTKTKNCTKNDNGTISGTGCKGYIDVNGVKGPNKIVGCDGANADHATDCKVSSPTDIYPVIFYDQTILPNSDAARAVMFGK